MKIKNIVAPFFNFMVSPYKVSFQKMTTEVYNEKFLAGKSAEDLKFLYEKAWDAKTKEIDRYLGRANFAWAFQVAAFAGYFSILGSNAYNKNPEISYVVVTIGLITSFAWTLINRGSKYWQKHWNIHLSFIEDKITGPIQKTTLNAKSTSIGNITDIVPRFLSFIWLILAFKFFYEHISFNFKGSSGIDYVTWLTSGTAVYFICAMYFGYGKGDISKQ